MCIKCIRCENQRKINSFFFIIFLKCLVIGAYDGCDPGELRFTGVGKQFDVQQGGIISQLLKG